ncbi:MAG: cob(I)yrinic acid a,c-diamide adenosyltransferase [Burkholderiales bacterium]
MGHRLSKIVTRTGDDGTTGLGDGSRTAKASPRIEAIGEVDELNSCIGMLLAEDLPTDIRGCVLAIQNDLFDLGGELSIPGFESVSESHVARLEREIEAINTNLPPLKEFILPGGSRAAAQCHVARGVCRRAERRMVALGEIEAVSSLSRQYLNRLSDLLFVLAREINHRAQIPDVLWRKERG